jgi:hypothetical protein
MVGPIANANKNNIYNQCNQKGAEQIGVFHHCLVFLKTNINKILLTLSHLGIETISRPLFIYG